MYWLLNLVGLVRIAVQRQRSYLGLVIALTAGFVVAVALVVSIPLYADAVGYRTLRAELQPDVQGRPRPPFAFMFSHSDSNDTPLPRSRFRQADAYFQKSIASTLRLPPPQIFRYANTDKMQLYTGAGPSSGSALLYVNLGFATGIEPQIELTEGALPRPSTGKTAAVEVLISQLFAEKTGTQVGEEFHVQSGDDTFKLPVKVSGIWHARNPNDQFWFIQPDSLEDVLLLPEQTFNAHVLPQGPNARAQTLWYLIFDGSEVRNDDVLPLAGRIDAMFRHLGSIVPRIQMPISPRTGLERQAARVRLLTISLVVFALPILGLIAYFIIMIAGMVVQRQQNEIAVLRSRGASRSEVLIVYLIEGIILGVVALGLGLFLAGYAAMLMGWTRSFLSFEPRSDVPIRFSRSGLQGGFWVIGLTLIASLLPALGAAGHTIISYKQQQARSVGRPWWQRAYLDLLLLVPAYYGYRQLQERGTISLLGRGPSGGDPFTNPLLILAPAFVMVALSLLSVRLFPPLMAAVSALISRLPGVSGLLALRYLTRSPRSYTGPVLLLILTLSLATFTASMAQTLDHHLYDQVLYDVGARMRISDFGQSIKPAGNAATTEVGAVTSGPAGPSTGPAGPTTSSADAAPLDNGEQQYIFLPVTDYLNLPGVTAATRVTRSSTTVQTANDHSAGTVLGVDRIDFPASAAWREDYADQPLGALMNDLGAAPDGILVSRHYLQQEGLAIGTKISLELQDLGSARTVSFTIVGAMDYFPTLYPEDGPFFVVNADYLFAQEGDMFPYEVWLNVSPQTTVDQIQVGIAKEHMPAIVSSEAPDTILVAQERPERQGLYGLLSVGFLASALLTGLGFLFYSIVSFQRRFIELGMLRAIGLSVRQMAVLLFCEQALIIGMGIAAGTALGVLVSRLFIPFLQVRSGDHPQTPPFVVQIAWGQVRLIYVIFAILLGLALSAVALLLLRMKIFQAVKLGEAA